MLSERIRQLRTDKGLTQQDLADALGITQQAVGRWEKGLASPDTPALPRLANLLGVSTDYLLGISNERRPGAGVLPIDDPEVLAFMQSVTSQFRLAPNITDKARQEILEDMADYFKFQLEKRKAKVDQEGN